MVVGPKGYQYAEGGGSNPAFGEDWFQRITGVHWPRKGGAPIVGAPVFATGCLSDLQHTLIIGQRELIAGEPASRIQFASGNNPVFAGGGINASSNHIIGPDTNGKFASIMLVGGVTGGLHYTDGTIAASVNGSSWTQVANFHDSSSDFGSDFNDTTIMGLVYDQAAGSFYACGRNVQYRKAGEDNHIESKVFETLYSSSNGLSWSESGRRQIYDSEGNPPIPDPSPPDMFLAHCNNVPHLQDGVFGHFELISPIDGSLIESLTAVPTSTPKINVMDTSPICTPSSSIDVTYYKRGGEGFSGTATAPFPVNAVSYVGGVLVATGGSADGTAGQTAVSFDYGAHWVAAYGPEEFAFWTVCGGFMG